jgi:hypothetical protein
MQLELLSNPCLPRFVFVTSVNRVIMTTPFPEASGEQDEEEVAALAPEENGDHTAAVAPAGPPRPSLSTVLPTRGVASVMAGLVFLALLVGFGRWIKLDNVSIKLAIHFVLQCSMPFKKS